MEGIKLAITKLQQRLLSLICIANSLYLSYWIAERGANYAAESIKGGFPLSRIYAYVNGRKFYWLYVK